ncbi:MAG: hypothetical protein EA341_11575 [Mongoliibacter sp.]|uniref:hypothetical protein n=1 Tax=Mongoliibacter sp. TaxID=2022438 RepID=UPI0012EEF1BB|nr:hypothetical protein [Mongoliibacter sp.]TVP48118.1 MAG: hypothetical protein EA341_11575 [Mongoliibacter sp.]
MGFRKLKIWGFFLAAIVVVGFILFQQSQDNKVQLDNQAIRNLEMVKTKFFSFYHSFLAEHEDRFVRYVITEKLGENNFPSEWKEFAASLKSITGEQYREFKSLNNKDSLNSSLEIVSKNGEYELKKIRHPVNPEFFEDGEFKFIDSVGNPPKINLTIPLANALSLSAQHDFFEKILLADENGEILYPSMDIGKKLLKLTEKDGLDLPITKAEIIHQDQSYFLYYTPFFLEGEKLILAGLISKKHYESLGFRIDFSYLSLLLFLLAMMIFSLPIISLFGFRRGDVLTRFKVFSVGLSLFGFMLLMGLGFAFVKDHHPYSEEEHSKKRERISDEIEKEIDANQGLLRKTFGSGGLMEYLTIDCLGKMQTLVLGDMQLPGRGSFINLSEREYFYHFSGNNFRECNDPQSIENEFFIGSHYSRKDGSLETVISKLDTLNCEVKAVTFKWNALKELSDKHRFILVKDNGDVIFKSEKVKAPFDNLSRLLSNENWLLLKNIMQSNKDVSQKTAWDLNLHVDGYSYILNLQKIPVSDFDRSTWLIYLQDEHLEHSFSFFVVLEAFVLLSGYILLLLLLAILRWSFSPKSNYGLWTDFSYNHLFPSRLNSSYYLFLILLFMILIMVMLGMYHFLSVNMFTLYFFTLCFMVFSTQAIFIFLEMRWTAGTSAMEKNINRLYAIKFLGFTSLIMVFLAIFFKGAMSNPLLAFCFVFIFILLVFGCFLLKVYFEKLLLQLENGNANTWLKKQIPWLETNHLYAWFFVLWITLIGFFPGYMIFSKTFQQEKEVWQAKSITLQENAEGFSSWIGDYSQKRRNLFTSFPIREDEELLEFVTTSTGNIDFLIRSKKENEQDSKEIKQNGIEFFTDLKLRDILSVLSFILFFWIIYWLNKTVAKKMFFAGGINPKLNETISDIQSRLLEKRKSIQMDDQGELQCRFFFIHRLISDGNKELVAKLFKIEVDEIYGFDGKLINVLDHFSPKLDRELEGFLDKQGTLMVENLHCIADSSKLLERLSYLMEFCEKHDMLLVLISGISWKQMISKVEGEQQKLHFSEVFSPFVFSYIPIKDKDFSKSNFEHISKVIDENPIIPHDVETKLLLRQRFFKADYTNIWAELSAEEKKVTYEFAVHEFLNYAAAPVIVELIQKGILVYEAGKDRFSLFSDTFRYFILLHISREEKDTFKKLELNTGNATSIQIAVFSFVLISVAMISYFDRSFLDQATAYVTGIVGTLGGIYSVFRSKFWKNPEVVK